MPDLRPTTTQADYLLDLADGCVIVWVRPDPAQPGAWWLWRGHRPESFVPAGVVADLNAKGWVRRNAEEAWEITAAGRRVVEEAGS